MHLEKHSKEIRRFIRDGDYEITDGGILIHNSIRGAGTYYHTVDGEDEQVDHNLLPAEGILDMLDVYYGATAKRPTFYLSLYTGNTTPVPTWTAANYVANATESTSTTEGYSGSVRPEFVDAPASGGIIGNLASRASYTIVTATSIDFYGAALHSVDTRGAVTGVLPSATRFLNKRTLYDAQTFELGYAVELTDS